MRELLEDIQAKLKARVYRNEEHVRLSLIARLLQALGWDIWNPEEVNAEHCSCPHEDSKRVDFALFSARDEPQVFIEAKAHGKLEGNIEKIEKQLRDYNRDITAPFSVITDGRAWRFYYSQTGGDFSSKCFVTLDLAEDDAGHSEETLRACLAKSEVTDEKTRAYAERRLALTRKQRLMEEAYPEAYRMRDRSPSLSFVEAMRQIVDKKVTEDEIRHFLETRTEQRALPSVTNEPPIRKRSVKNAEGADEAKYGAYRIVKLKTKTIEVYKNGVKQEKAKPHLRDIARELGVSELNSKGKGRNTRQFGDAIIRKILRKGH